MKTKKILKILGVISLLFVLFRIINPNYTKKIAVLDCSVEYKMSVFGREYEGFNYHNSKMDVAKCLCEKYLKTKERKYESEIRKIINEFELENAVYNMPIEKICTEREDVFFYRYYE
jgi:hypothetical protein